MRRELTPFCGIMKVGGLAVQGWDYGLEREDGEVEGEEDVPFLSSQGSTITTVSEAGDESWMPRTGTGMGGGQKRRFDEGDDDDVRIEGQEAAEEVVYDIWRDDDDLQLSPKTRPVDLGLRTGLSLGLGRRVMAVPKSRRKDSSRVGEFKTAVMEGQENSNVVDIDFGEAEFMDWSACA
jgi:hypothetical protein